MSEIENAGAQASVSEAVSDENKAVPVEAKEEVKAAPEADGAVASDAETAEQPVEGAEVVETEEEKKTKSALRRERQKARLANLEAENQRLADQLARIERDRPVAQDLGDKPDRSKYEDEAEYVSDLSAWKVRKDFAERQSKAHETHETNAKAESAAVRMTLFKERAMALSDRYPDIEAKVFNDATLPMSAAMAEVLMESEKGPEVAYHLAANREIAQRIKSMPPLQAARELGRIEANLSLPKPRTETQAPPPPKIIGGGTGAPTRKPEEMSHAEYREWRKSWA